MQTPRIDDDGTGTGSVDACIETSNRICTKLDLRSNGPLHHQHRIHGGGLVSLRSLRQADRTVLAIPGSVSADARLAARGSGEREYVNYESTDASS